MNILNKIIINLMGNPFFISILSTLILLILMQTILPFSGALIILNFVLVYHFIYNNFKVNKNE